MARRRSFAAAPREEEPGESEAARWKLQIELFERDNEAWEKRGEEILKRYRDERSAGSMSETYSGKRRYNILWSNVQTLKPSLYSREPVPIAERRFLDKDVVGRISSQILERGMRYEMMDCGFHDTVTKCVYDYLLPGRGVAWLTFKPAFGPASSIEDRGDDQLQEASGDPVGDEDGRSAEADEHNESEERTEESPAEKLIGASLGVDYVNWKDFGHSKARTWKETEWIFRRHYMTRDDLIDNFGEKIGKEIPLDRAPDLDKQHTATRSDRMMDGLKKATVHEIWWKPKRQVIYVAKGYHKLCKAPVDDPLNLEGFWPCPEPLFATMTTDTIRPVADYAEYQDQAYELDRLTARMEQLIASIQVRGVYDGANRELGRLLDEGNENKMIAVKAWSAFAEKGGLKGAVDFLPIEQSVEAVKVLLEARKQVKEDLYEITGLADVIRGQADPRETAEAVKTKGRFGSMRLQDRQADVARFCRDIIRMMGEIIAEHFPDETLIDISGIMYDEGIGPEMPTPPMPPQQPPQSPMMGHNGGPPMQPQQVAQAPQGPPMAPGAPPSLVQGSQGLQPPSSSGLPASASAAPQPGMAPPAIPPEQQYAMAMADYQQKLAAAQAEKQDLVQKAIALLRQDKLRGFRIDIETDTTIVNDVQEDKASRVEFMQALSGMLEKSMAAAQADPEITPLLGKLILFVVRGFRAGRDLENSIEEYIDQKEKEAKASIGQPKPPDPKVQAEQIKAQAEIEKSKLDTQSAAADHQSDMAMKQLEAKLAQERAAMETQHMQMEAQFKERELQLKMQEMELKMRLTEHETNAKLQMAEREGSLKMQLAEREHAMKSTMMERQHQQGMEAGEIAHKRTLEAGEAAHKQKLEAFKMQPQHANGAGA